MGASREEPPSTLLAWIIHPTWVFVCPTLLKMAPPPHAAAPGNSKLELKTENSPSTSSR